MSKFEKLAQHIRSYLTAEATTEEIGKVHEILISLDQKESTNVQTRRRSSSTGKRGPLYKTVESFGTGGSLRDIGNKARELGLRLPPDPTAQDRSVNRKLVQSPHVYKKNEDGTWRLLRLPTLKAI